jgi:acetyltransferase-like isoleucine patch superfamily enzyme/dTDP-4-dehydrorhamnose 3,5-epimerase-like enzyme
LITKPAVHETAIVEAGAKVGEDSRISAFAHVVDGATVGRGTVISDHVVIDGGAVIGDRVTIRSGVCVCTGVRIEDDVTIDSGVSFAPPAPGGDARPEGSVARTCIGRRASLGANSTVHSGISIGQNAVVSPGAVVARDVPPYAIVTGNPATIRGYVTDARATPRPPAHVPAGANRALAVRNAKVIDLPHVQDLRGDLVFGEVDRHLPFTPKRVFSVFGVPSPEIRGEHAHRECHQLLICVSGSVAVMVDDGRDRDTVTLDRPNLALHIPPMIWASQYHYSPDATLVVLASDVYDAADYIREYEQFLTELRLRDPQQAREGHVR